MRNLFIRLGVLLVLVSACGRAFSQSSRPLHWPLYIGDSHYPQLELALTDQERSRGLMHRRSLPQDGGMLFVFEREKPLAFWMKNTLIPLDILYLDRHGVVVSIHTMQVEPPAAAGEVFYEQRLPSYPSAQPAQFAIELNAGEAARNGIRVGDTIQLNRGSLLPLLATP